MIAQKLILGYGSKVIMQLLAIIASLVVARIAGPTVLGTLAFGLSFVSVFSFINVFWGPAHIKLVSEGKNLGDCISTFAVLKFMTTGLFILVVAAAYIIQKYVLKVDFESVVHQYVIFIMLSAVVIEQLLSIPKSTFAAGTEQAKQDIPELIKTFVCHILRVVFVLFGFRAIALASSNLIAVLVIAPIVIFLFKDYPRTRFDKSLAVRYLKISIPFLFTALCHNAVNYLDKVMLQYFSNSQQVGYYSAGYRVGGFFLLMAGSVGILFFPIFSKAVADGNYMYIRDKVLQFERFSFLFIMPFVLFLVLYSDVIVKLLLGGAYISSIPVLSIITAATFIRVMSDPYGNVLSGLGLFNLLMILNIVNLVFFILVIFVLVSPSFMNLGAYGVAFAVLGSNVLIGILFRIFARANCRVLDLKRNLRFVFFGVSNIVLFGILYNFGRSTYGAQFQIIFPVIYFGITYLFMLIFKWIDKEDWRMLLSIVQIDKVLAYVRTEMKAKR